MQEDTYNKDNSRREWKQQQKWKPEKMYNFQNVFNVHFFYVPSGREAVDINSRKNYQKDKSGHFIDLIYVLKSLDITILLNYSVVNHQTFLEIRYALEIQLWRQCRRKTGGLKKCQRWSAKDSYKLRRVMLAAKINMPSNLSDLTGNVFLLTHIPVPINQKVAFSIIVHRLWLFYPKILPFF